MTPGVNFINILRTTFLPIFWRQKITKPNVTRKKLLNLLLYKNLSSKMLMKLTPVVDLINNFLQLLAFVKTAFWQTTYSTIVAKQNNQLRS